MTAPEFVAESIEMKMRWLARRLRKTDTTVDIEQWVKAITLLENLLQRLQGGCKRKPLCFAGHGTQPRKRTCFTISAPCSTDSKGGEFGSDNRVSPRTSIEVEVAESKPEKNKGTDTQGDGREATRRKSVSFNEDEHVKTVEPTDQMVIDDEYVHPPIPPISDRCWEIREGAGNSVEEIIQCGGVKSTDIEGTDMEHPEVKDRGAITQMVRGPWRMVKKKMSKEKRAGIEDDGDIEPIRAWSKEVNDRWDTVQVEKGWKSNVTSRLESLEGPLGCEIKNKLEIWREEMLRRLVLEKKESKDWGDIYGTQFTELCCYTEDLKDKVMKYIGQEPVRKYLYGEMITFINQKKIG